MLSGNQYNSQIQNNNSEPNPKGERKDETSERKSVSERELKL